MGLICWVFFLTCLFTLMSFISAVWAQWGAIATSTKFAFHWSDHTTALLANWGPISYIVGAPFFAWLIGSKGIRLATLVTAGLVTVGTGLRCISSRPPYVTWLVHIGQMLNGLAGPIAFGASTVVSATWFPVNQRTTATAAGSILNGLGCAVPYLVGPMLVPTKINSTNGTGIVHGVEDVRRDIMFLMYIAFGWSALLFLMILIYFPSKPPTPPSISASLERLDYKNGLLHIMKNKKLWILSLCYAIPTGFQSGVGAVLDVDLNVIGVSQIDAGLLGFVASCIANVFTILLGIFSDIFKRRMKLFVISFYSIGLIAFVVFICVYIKLIPYSSALLWTTYIINVIGVWAPSPIFFELSAEVNYPVAEGTSHGFITWLANITGGIFLGVLMIPSVGTGWMNWALLGSLIFTIPIMCLFQENYTRLDIDTEENCPGKVIRAVPAYLHGPVTPHPLYN